MLLVEDIGDEIDLSCSIWSVEKKSHSAEKFSLHEFTPFLVRGVFVEISEWGWPVRANRIQKFPQKHRDSEKGWTRAGNDFLHVEFAFPQSNWAGVAFSYRGATFCTRQTSRKNPKECWEFFGPVWKSHFFLHMVGKVTFFYTSVEKPLTFIFLQCRKVAQR